ncbi:hypothetical protein ACROYT_G020105 [Oculina patagonica]
MPLEPLWESHEMYRRSLQAFTDSSTIKQPAMHGVRQALIKIIEKVDIEEPPSVGYWKWKRPFLVKITCKTCNRLTAGRRFLFALIKAEGQGTARSRDIS